MDYPPLVNAEDKNCHVLWKNISGFISLTDSECTAAAKYFRTITLDKKDHWLWPGSMCKEVAFVIEGCLKIYSLRNGTERITHFIAENQWYTDYEGWLTYQASEMGAMAVEPTRLFVTTFPELENLYTEIPKFERVGRLIAENTIVKIKNRNVSLLTVGPEERYLELVREQPDLVSRVPQHMIASYLGIEPESLSRIRKKLSKSNTSLNG